MDALAHKLTKLRRKSKTSQGTRKIASSQSKVSHKNNTSVVKASTRKNSKKMPMGMMNRRIIN